MLTLAATGHFSGLKFGREKFERAFCVC